MRYILAQKLKKAVLFISVSFVMLHHANSQQKTESGIYTTNQLFKLAKKCGQRNEYLNALFYMEEYLQLKNDNPKAIYFTAELYQKSKQYEKAIRYYSDSVLIDNKKFPLTNYQLGRLNMVVQNYPLAKDQFTKFRRTYKNGKDAKIYRKLAQNFIIGCDSAMVADTNQLAAKIHNIGNKVNSEHIEFSPHPLTPELLLYGSLPIDSVNIFSHSAHNAPVRQVYLAQKKENGWENIGIPDWEINHPEYNTGNVALSPDGKRLYFSRCKENWKFEMICEICMLEKINESWTNFKKLNEEINNVNYTASQPAVGINPKDGTDILYFASKRPGGKGGMDIWYAQYNKRKKTFKSPKNAGSKINTYNDEITPYVNVATQTLYFSSNGLPGLGEFDIYQSRGWGQRWEKAQNVGTPINSSYNDMYLALNADGNSGFFTSNRPGSQLLASNTCCADIYSFNWNLSHTVPAKGLVVHKTVGNIIKIIDEKFNTSIKPLDEGTLLDNVPVFLYLLEDDGSQTLVQTTHTVNGEYNLNLERNKTYSIEIKNYGYSDTTVKVSTINNLSEDTLRISTTAISYIPSIELDFNVYYKPGHTGLDLNAQKLIDTTVIYLLELLPTAIIEIGSHTDNLGPADFNLKLSQKRADEVVKNLIKKGISDERLEAKGFGEDFPIAENQFPDGSDNPEGRKKNRRTQIKIIGTLISNEGDTE